MHVVSTVNPLVAAPDPQIAAPPYAASSPDLKFEDAEAFTLGAASRTAQGVMAGPLKALAPPKVRPSGGRCDAHGRSTAMQQVLAKVSGLFREATTQGTPVDTQMRPLDVASYASAQHLLSYSFFTFASAHATPKPRTLARNPLLVHHVVGYSAVDPWHRGRPRQSVDVWDLRYTALRAGVTPAFSFDVHSQPIGLSLEPSTTGAPHHVSALQLSMQFWDGTVSSVTLVADHR